MKNNIPEELFPIVDEAGNEISAAPRTLCHDGKSMLLHPVVHFHLFSDRGELYLQKRAMTKDLLPGNWDTSVGGHICPGESAEEALRREALEELGLKNFKFQLVARYIWESPHEREFVYSFKGNSDEIVIINPEEIDDGRYWTIEEIRDKMDKGIFTPNFEFEYKRFLTTG